MSVETDDLMASRSGNSVLGKCTEPVKTMLPIELLQQMQRRARDLGMTDSEYVRDLIAVSVLGLETVASMHRSRLEAVAMNRAGIGTHG